MLHARADMTATKVVELVTEAIPGCVIQLAAMTMGGGIGGVDISSGAKFSFICSVFTANFTSATLSHDWDTGKDQRKYAPWFYGYMPDSVGGQVVVFLSFHFSA